jgi:hypothetical protein
MTQHTFLHGRLTVLIRPPPTHRAMMPDGFRFPNVPPPLAHHEFFPRPDSASQFSRFDFNLQICPVPICTSSPGVLSFS